MYKKLFSLIRIALIFVAAMFVLASTVQARGDVGPDSYIPVWEKLPLKDPQDWAKLRTVSSQALEAGKKSLLSLPPENNDEKLAHTYAIMGHSYRMLGHFDSAEYILKRAEKLSAKLTDKELNLQIAYLLSTVYSRLGKIEQMVEIATKIDQYSRVITDSFCLSLANLSYSFMYSDRGLGTATIKHLYQASNYLPRSRDISLQYQIIQTNLGAEYIRSGKYTKAENSYREFISSLDKDERPNLFSIATGNFAFSLIRQEKYREAVDYLLSIEDDIKAADVPYVRAYHMALLAYSYQKMGQWDMALPRIKTTDSLLVSSQNSQMYGFRNLVVGHQLEQEGKYEEALARYRASLKTAAPNKGLANLDESYQAIAGVLRRMGRTEEAAEQLNKLIYLKDSIFESWQNNVFELILVKDSLQENISKIRGLEQMQERDKLASRLLWVALGLLLVLAGLALALMRNSYIRKREERIQHYNKQLRAYTAELEDMAYATSHYLKEPVRGVGAYAGLIQKKLGNRVSSDEQEDLQFMGNSAKKLTVLMAELSDFFKLGTNPGPRSKVDTDQLLRGLISELNGQIDEKDQGISLRGTFPILHIHKDLLRKAFSELIDNALAFKGEKSLRVEISHEEDQDHHYFSFKDFGMGLSPAYASKIFSIFYQIDPYSPSSGTGIGLSRVRKIVRIYQGEVDADGIEGEFAEIVLKLPKEEVRLSQA